MANKGSGTGQGGKSFQDRELAANVRTKALEDIYLVLHDAAEISKWSEYRKSILLTLSKSILPRLNEVSGVDGEAIVMSWLK